MRRCNLSKLVSGISTFQKLIQGRGRLLTLTRNTLYAQAPLQTLSHSHSPTASCSGNRGGVGALFSSSRAADNTATTAADSHTSDNASTTGTPCIGGFFRRRSTGSPDVDSTRDTQRRRGSIGSSTAATDTAVRTGSQARRSGRGTDRSLDAARHKVTLAEKAEKEADA